MADDRHLQTQLLELKSPGCCRLRCDICAALAAAGIQRAAVEARAQGTGSGGGGGSASVPAEGVKAPEMGSRRKVSKDKGDLPKGTRSEAHVMTLREVCAYFRIQKSTLMRLIDAGKIPHSRMGSAYRFNRETIETSMRDRG
jgi:excisionase family DNA binding protein